MGGGNSSAADVADTEGFKGEGEVSAVAAAESEGSLLTANSSFNPLVNASNGTDSNMGVVSIENIDERVQESNGTVDTVEVVVESDSSEGEREEHSSIQISVEDKSRVDCDVTKGRWVFDESYPLYTNATCPFIDEGFSCESNGRLDKGYMKWRWQPQDCSIPR